VGVAGIMARRWSSISCRSATITTEIDQIHRQKLAAERHRDTVLRELDIQHQQVEHAIEV
jgi:hypothetical protein